MKIALVEVYSSHSECLFTQLEILKTRFTDVTLVCPDGLKNQVSKFNHNNIIFKNTDFSKKSIQKYREFLNDKDFDLIIFNTAQGKLKRLFYSWKPLKCKKVFGTIHNAKKLKSSLGQKIISRNMNGYFVLSDYVKDNLKKLNPNLPVESYYPIQYPNFETTILPKGKQEIWVTIPGNLEYKRRDFEGFFKRLKTKSINENIKFILLGKSTHKRGSFQKATEAIEQANLTDQFIIFKEFVSDEIFHSYMKQTDYILPLLHPTHTSFKEYQLKISGSFNLAYAYGIPLLLYKDFKKYEEFSLHPTIFYDLKKLIETLDKLSPLSKNVSLLKKQVLEHQAEKYLNFILN